MTTTRTGRRARPKKKAPSTADQRPETLAAFSAELDSHAGRAVGFADLVADLARTRAQLAQLKAARAAVFEKVKEGYLAGHRSAAGYQLKQTDPGEAVIYRAAESAKVKKADPAAWRAAQAEVGFVQVKPPASVRLAVPEVAVPEVGERAGLEAVVKVYKEAPAWELMRGLRDAEVELITRLDKLAADFGWDGLPLTFADGWTVGLRRRQFSSERLAEVAPELFELLAVAKVRQAPARVYVAKPGDTSEAVDLDAD